LDINGLILVFDRFNGLCLRIKEEDLSL
jgi:hypothetical protein